MKKTIVFSIIAGGLALFLNSCAPTSAPASSTVAPAPSTGSS